MRTTLAVDHGYDPEPDRILCIGRTAPNADGLVAKVIGEHNDGNGCISDRRSWEDADGMLRMSPGYTALFAT